MAGIAAMAAIGIACSGCAAIKKAPGINQLFGDEPALPDDPTAMAGVDYEIAVQGLGVGETPEETAENLRMLEIVKGEARVYKLQDKPPPSVALLRRRAAADVDLVERALKSEGYYEGSAVITVDAEAKEIGAEEEAADESGNGDAPIFGDIEEPETPPVVNILVRKGPRYALARQLVVIEPPVRTDTEERVRKAARKNVGGPAQGQAVVDAEQAALGELNREGRPYAEKGKRRAEANFDYDTLDVVTDMAPGPYTVYGGTEITGNTEVETKYIADFITWNEGEAVSRGTLRGAQRELAGTRLFEAVTVEIPSEPPRELKEGETFYAPVKIDVEEAKHRTVSAGLSYSTSDGAGGRVKWEHRNLFGQNEQFSAALNVTQVRQGIELDYKKPRFGRPERDLIANLQGFHEETDAFDVTGASGSVGIEQQLNKYLHGTLGLAFDVAQTKEDGVTRNSYLFGIPGTLTYDDTDSLLDPTEGVRASAAVTPWGGVFDDAATSFAVVDLHGSTYAAFDRKKKYVFAVRGRGAAVFAGSRGDVPPQFRLYSGGGGSVRGYETQFVGPVDNDGDPAGGLTAAELGVEMRMRFGSFGVVPFVDAGVVSRELFSEYDKVRYAAGLGLRYYSPVGPIRFDFAVPINGRDRDDAFQFYLSIGQAF